MNSLDDRYLNEDEKELAESIERDEWKPATDKNRLRALLRASEDTLSLTSGPTVPLAAKPAKVYAHP
jgi:hypothetical protein